MKCAPTYSQLKALRNAMSSVLHALMKHQCTTADGNGIRVPDIVKQPDLPQAKVNKCLIALVQKKAVLKWTESVSTVVCCLMYSY